MPKKLMNSELRKCFKLMSCQLPHTAYCLQRDPRHLCFTLARYKFCAKILEGRNQVLETGCGDGFGVPLVAQTVKSLLCLDWDSRQIEGNRRRLSFLSNVTFEHCDITASAPVIQADAAYSIDVIEHIDPKREDTYLM